MKWFRHHSNAHKGSAIQSLIPVFGKAQGLGLYFLLVEYCADKWDGVSPPVFKIHQQELRSFLGLKQNKLTLFLESIKNQRDFSYVQTEFFFEIYFPKLLEVRHRDALNASTRQALVQHESGGEENRVEEKRIDKKRVEEGAAPTLAENSLAKMWRESDKAREADHQKLINLANQKAAAGSEGSKPTSPATAQPLEEKRFKVIDDLQGLGVTGTVLERISESAQKSWVSRYELQYLRNKLCEAVEHHLSTSGLEASQIDDWGRRLSGWLRREKKPRLVNPGLIGGPVANDLDLSQAELESLFPSYEPAVKRGPYCEWCKNDVGFHYDGCPGAPERMAP